MTRQDPSEEVHSERAIDAMELYLSEGVYFARSHEGLTQPQALVVAAYMQGVAVIQAAELTALALGRLESAIALAARPVRGSA